MKTAEVLLQNCASQDDVVPHLLSGVVLFSVSCTELLTILRLRQEDDNLLFVAAVVRFLSCLRPHISSEL